MSEHLRCAALLHGGKQCRSVAVDGTEFCQHHGALVAEHGAEAMKRGEHLPVRRKRIVQAAVLAEATEATTTARSWSTRPRCALD